MRSVGSLTSQIDFTSCISIEAGAARQLDQHAGAVRRTTFSGPDSLLNQPLVGLPFVDSLVHRATAGRRIIPYRSAMDGRDRIWSAPPRLSAPAVEIIGRGSIFASDRLPRSLGAAMSASVRYSKGFPELLGALRRWRICREGPPASSTPEACSNPTHLRPALPPLPTAWGFFPTSAGSPPRHTARL